jgi:serine phosphatase RsbU (regulator of sigma subunit)
VPHLGDWCSIYVLADENARVPEVETAHVDPEMVAYARKLQAQFPYDPDARTGMPAVIRTGTPEIHRDIDDAVMADLSVTGEARDIVQRLALRSSIAVPITKRGRTLGGLQLIMTESRRRYSDDDLALAEAVAARIAASLDNLRLAELNRSIAITLQEGLLPDELPDIPGVEVAVRYWAHGEGVEVGGDFYDLFELADDRWAVVIGDVCGKGPGAAAVTGLARHTIASSAWHGDDHEQVLRSLNRTMRSRRSRAFCTALYGTVQRRPNGVELTFASGGHPLPLLARPGCPAFAVGLHGSLIGVLEDIDVTTTTVTLLPGDTVVLYTDGATDVSPPHGLTDAALAELVEGAAAETASADALADRLHVELSRILEITERTDDIALLILRLPPA